MALEAKWRAFAAIALTYVTIVFATSMSFLVLTSISDEFGVTLAAVSWVVIIEALIVAALLLPLGSLGDRLGRRRVLAAGMAVFGVGCVLTGLAPTFGLVIGARIITSIGNALVQSIGTGLLMAAFPGDERGLAMGSQTTAVAIGSATGPLLVGLALDVMSWRVIFALLAVPSAIAVALVIAMIEPDGRAGTEARRPIDRLSALLSATAITVLTITINNPFDWAWSSWPVAAGGLLTVALIDAYVRHERASSDPMFDLGLFSIPSFRTATVVRVIGFIASTTLSLLLPVLLIGVLELRGAVAGLVISSLAVGMGVSAQISGRLYDRIGPRTPTLVGLGLQTLVFGSLVLVDTTTAWGWLVLASVTQGLAMGLWNVPNNSAMIGAMPRSSFGVGGAFTNVTRTIGNVFGQALAAAVVVAVLRRQGFDVPLGDIEDTPGAAPSFIDGWRLAFAIASAISLVLAMVAAALGWNDHTQDRFDGAEPAASHTRPAGSVGGHGSDTRRT